MKTTFDLVQAFLLSKESFTSPQNITLTDYEIVGGCNLKMSYSEKKTYNGSDETYYTNEQAEWCLLDYMTFLFNKEA